MDSLADAFGMKCKYAVREMGMHEVEYLERGIVLTATGVVIHCDPKYAPIFVEADGHGRRTSPRALRMFWTRSLWRLWLTRELMPLTSGTRLRSLRGGPHGDVVACTLSKTMARRP